MKFELITSAQNDAVKHLVKLRDRRHRDRERLTLLEGYRELTRAEEYGMILRECFFSPRHFLGTNEFPLLERLAAKGCACGNSPPSCWKRSPTATGPRDFWPSPA